MFYNLAISDKDFGNSYNFPNTKMSKALGYGAALMTSNKLHIKENELSILQDIIRIYGETKTLHSQIVLQTLQYRDCAPEAISGELRTRNDKPHNLATDKHNFYSYVHPVIGALFIPSIKLLDEHMLIANLGYIVKCKNDGKPIMTKPDFELYWDLITDRNDHACSMESAIKDIKNRYILQKTLWECVLNLRQGRYYNDRLADFLLAIENCRSNVYDAPDLTYVKDEGTILRRLLSAFSLRPTIVSTTRLYGLIGQSPYTYGSAGSASGQLTSSGITQVTTVPMVTLRLPLNISNKQMGVSLEEALTQPQWFVENKMIIPKSQQIMHSRDVLFFYVGRRFKTVNITRLNMPYNFSNLPMTIAGWEALNDHIVNYEPTMTIFNDTYNLRSVVIVDCSPTKKNLIVGCSAGIITKRDWTSGRIRQDYLLYDPQGSAEMFKGTGGEYVRNNPITTIPGYTSLNASDIGGVESFSKRASTRGTIFVYEKSRDGNNPFTGECNNQ
jgi:hypothetical protein